MNDWSAGSSASARTLPGGLSLPGQGKINFAAESAKAMAAERAEDWDLALTIWSVLKQHSFDARVSAVAIGRCLRSRGDLDEADTILRDALTAYPTDLELLAEYALVAKMQNNPSECAKRWRALANLHPHDVLFSGEAALAFLNNGDAPAAAALLETADRISPNNPQILVPKAVVAQHMENWAEAARCWRELRMLMPADKGFSEFHANALWHASFDERHSVITDFLPIASKAGSDDPFRDSQLAEMFESLGDNCEFGFVQRLLGAEPVSLYRFAAVSPGKMLILLEKDFSPLGDPQHTIIDAKAEEYIAFDDRGYFWLHTMVMKTDMLASKQLKQQTARIIILRKKLLANLYGNSRIFVFKDSETSISDDMLESLSKAVRRYANNLVLGIRLADRDHPSGSISRLSDHIVLGYIDRMFVGNINRLLSASDIQHPDNIDMNGWLGVLSKTLDYALAQNYVTLPKTNDAIA